MTKDIMWDEKVRVSALRAACASEYESESEFVTADDGPESKWAPETDERRTERILLRAACFERWLTRGALGDHVEAESEEPPTRMKSYFGTGHPRT
jgi:hypothetical protein